jgi:hypothetical protein
VAVIHLLGCLLHMMMHFLTLNCTLRHFTYPRHKLHIWRHFTPLNLLGERHALHEDTWHLFCYPKGKVEPHLEERSIDLVLYCYFNVHHWKMTFLKGHQGRRLHLACTYTCPCMFLERNTHFGTLFYEILIVGAHMSMRSTL